MGDRRTGGARLVEHGDANRVETSQTLLRRQSASVHHLTKIHLPKESREGIGPIAACPPHDLNHLRIGQDDVQLMPGEVGRDGFSPILLI